MGLLKIENKKQRVHVRWDPKAQTQRPQNPDRGWLLYKGRLTLNRKHPHFAPPVDLKGRRRSMASNPDQMLYAAVLTLSADSLKSNGELIRDRFEKVRAMALNMRFCGEETRSRSTVVPASADAARELFALAQQMFAFADGMKSVADEMIGASMEMRASSLVTRPSYEEIRRNLTVCRQKFQAGKDKMLYCADKVGAFGDKMKALVLENSPISSSDFDSLVDSFSQV